MTCSTCIYGEIVPKVTSDIFGKPGPIELVCECYFMPEPITRRADKFCSEHITIDEYNELMEDME